MVGGGKFDEHFDDRFTALDISQLVRVLFYPLRVQKNTCSYTTRCVREEVMADKLFELEKGMRVVIMGGLPLNPRGPCLPKILKLYN